MSPARSISKAQVIAMADLPEPSAMLVRIVPMLSSEDIGLESLVSELERDQALVARMLKLVNSSYYHLKSKVDTVRTAVGLLGLATVRQLVYSAMCYSCFPEDERLSWSHAYTCSLLIAKLSKGGEDAQGGCLQLTALLHDIGKIVLRRKFAMRYKTMLRKGERLGIPPHESEKEAFHHEHGEIGSWLLESWQMRPDIVMPIAWHHSETLPDVFARETALLRVADWLDNQARELPRPMPGEEVFASACVPFNERDALLSSHVDMLKAVESDPDGIFAG